MRENNNDSDDDNSFFEEKKKKKFDPLKISNKRFKKILEDSNEENEEKDNIMIQNDLNESNDDIDNEQKLQKLICPECTDIPIVKIFNDNFTIQSSCLNKHSNEYTLIDYIKKVEEKLNKDDIKCSNCNKTISELKNKENDMYLCNCKKYFCNTCKTEHENNENNEENNENNENNDNDYIQHYLVEYNKKDYQCMCSENLEDYNFYCKNCTKNLCAVCESNHPQDHPIIEYSDEINKSLTNELLNQKKQEFEEQKKIIKDCLNKIYNLRKSLDKKIKHFEDTLNSYIEINKYIIEKFDKSSLNMQMIENIKNINFRLPQKLHIFNNAKNEKDSFTFLMILLDYQDKKNQKNQNEVPCQKYKEPSIYNINNFELMKAKGNNIKEEICFVCQLKKGIAVADKKGKIHCFSFEDNKLKNNFIILNNNKGSNINYLYSLKNGNLISSNQNELIIYELSEKGEKIIQIIKYQNDNEIIRGAKSIREIKTTKASKIQFPTNLTNNDRSKSILIFHEDFFYYQILELINNYLLYIDKDKLMVLKHLNNYKYQENPFKALNLDIISMTELSPFKFCVYTKKKDIIVIDSNTFEEKNKFQIMPNLIKIERVNNDIIVGLTKDNQIALICEGNKKLIENEENIDNNRVIDVCGDVNKIIVAHQNYIKEYNIKVNEKGKYSTFGGKLDIIDKSVKNKIINNICLLKNNKYDNNVNDKNGKLDCIFKNIFLIYQNKAMKQNK